MGCTKDKIEDCPGQCTVLTGHLVTSGSQPLEGATVTAAWHNGLGFAGYAPARTKARTTTDAQGNYQLSFYVKDDELHEGYVDVTYQVDKDRYYALATEDGPDTGPTLGLRRDTLYRIPSFLIPRKGFVKLTVANPDQIQEEFAVSFTSAQMRSLVVNKEFSGGGPVVGIPKQQTPFTTLLEVAADQKLYVRTTRRLGTVYTRTLDSLQVAAGNTRELTIRY
jgi:hypothetical protein